MPKKPTQQESHHIRRLHRHRLGLFLVLAVGLVGLHGGSHPARFEDGKVLAYATNVSINGLFNATNADRAAQGLGALALNSALNNGAQAKANHMIANNYWSHVAPDGTQPWFFFTQAGYKYEHAGENLAYGFDSSTEIEDAWMNSSGHRANVLGDYKDVGFGIASGESYQGGENTVVVAFYGTQAAPPPPPPAPKPAPKAAQTAPVQAPTAPTKTSQPEPQPASAPPTAEPKPQPATTEPTAAPAAPKNVTTLENLLGGNGTWLMYGSLGIVSASVAGFGVTHWRLVRRGWKHSAHFILVHPALDTALLVALIAALLTSTIGFIR